MTNAAELQPAAEPTSGPRSIKDIIAVLSKPVAQRHLKQRQQGGRTLDYLPWYTAVKYLDLFAGGWRYEIRSVAQVGNNLVMVVRITIPCAEGEIWREASALEVIEDPKRYGDAATNCESAALRRAASKFGLALHLYDR
jgi:Rad52/22 family double-strand break repair protein